MKASTALARASCCRRSWWGSWERDFFFLGNRMRGRGWGGWWGRGYGKRGWSGGANTADNCIWGFPSSQANSSFAFPPLFQCLASCQKLENATYRLEIFKFSFHKICTQNSFYFWTDIKYFTIDSSVVSPITVWLLQLSLVKCDKFTLLNWRGLVHC